MWACWRVAGSPQKGWKHQLRNRVLPATGERREGDGLKLLVLSCGQAVFDGLFQLFFTFVGAPLGDVTVDDKFGRESTGLADGSWDKGREVQVIVRLVSEGYHLKLGHQAGPPR